MLAVECFTGYLPRTIEKNIFQFIQKSNSYRLNEYGNDILPKLDINMVEFLEVIFRKPTSPAHKINIPVRQAFLCIKLPLTFKSQFAFLDNVSNDIHMKYWASKAAHRCAIACPEDFKKQGIEIA